ncbi:MAG: hypothetical protein FJW68_05645 [Actinobacteria bacterium]|nr:hypothetical protein [Actinomycetota bacterium]
MEIKKCRYFFKPLYFAALLVLSISLFFLFSCAGNIKPGGQAENPGSKSSTIDLEGKQIIEVNAVSGGYYPGSIKSKAGLPSVLRINSENSYGCERAFTIPQLKIKAILPINGITEIEIGEFEPGARLLGTCSMGMYSFVIEFE